MLASRVRNPNSSGGMCAMEESESSKMPEFSACPLALACS